MAQDSFARAVATASLDNTNTLDTRLTAVEESVAAGLKRVIVQQLPTEHISTTTIYMVPKSTVKPQQGYDEFMYINNAWEKIGDTEVDLTDYAQKTWVEGKGYITAAALDGYATESYVDTEVAGHHDTTKLDKGTTADYSEHFYTFDRNGQKTDKTISENISLGATDDQIPTALAVTTALNSKQSAITAGANIQINNNVISATDTTYTAGTNITIDENNVISATGGGGTLTINENQLQIGENGLETKLGYSIGTQTSWTQIYNYNQLGDTISESEGVLTITTGSSTWWTQSAFAVGKEYKFEYSWTNSFLPQNSSKITAYVTCTAYTPQTQFTAGRAELRVDSVELQNATMEVGSTIVCTATLLQSLTCTIAAPLTHSYNLSFGAKMSEKSTISGVISQIRADAIPVDGSTITVSSNKIKAETGVYVVDFTNPTYSNANTAFNAGKLVITKNNSTPGCVLTAYASDALTGLKFQGYNPITGEIKMYTLPSFGTWTETVSTYKVVNVNGLDSSKTYSLKYTGGALSWVEDAE